MEEMTKVQQLVEIANWAKKQPAEFTKHFPSMRSIIRVYRELPTDYDKKKSVVAYISKGMKSTNYLWKQRAERLALVFHSVFGVRYFKNAPHKYILRLSLSKWERRTGQIQLEVRCEPYDRCNLYDNFKSQSLSARTISIKTIGDAKRAAEQLIASWAKAFGEDYEVEYYHSLKVAMENEAPSKETLEEGIEVVI